MITLTDIKDAHAVISQYVNRTPLLHSESLSSMTGADVYLKCENLQKTGSFKVRGAFNKLSQLNSGRVVAASLGNHAQGVAYAATTLGIPARIIMPEGASIAKERAVRGYGAEVSIHGTSLSEAISHAHEVDDAVFIHPYDDDLVISGQGTVALEVLDELDAVDYLLVPVGGGGLISGIAVAVKAASPTTGVIGIQAEAAPSAHDSYARNKVIERKPGHTIADGIAVGMVGSRNLQIISRYVDDIVTVKEGAIAKAVLMFMERKRLVVEGAGAVPLACLMNSPSMFEGKRVVLIISGGNIDITLMDRIILKGLVEHGRIGQLQVSLEDVPGALNRITRVITQKRSNILSIRHDRFAEGMPVGKTSVRITLETISPNHFEDIVGAIADAGIEVIT